VSSIFAEQKLGGKIDLLQIIINPFAYVAGNEDTKLTDSISNSLEPICRQLLYALHNNSDFLHKGQIGLVAFFENADLLDCSI
jgi:hypothetical protein